MSSSPVLAISQLNNSLSQQKLKRAVDVQLSAKALGSVPSLKKKVEVQGEQGDLWHFNLKNFLLFSLALWQP